MRPIFERNPLPSILEQIKKVQIQIRCARTTNVNICRNNISAESFMPKYLLTYDASKFFMDANFVINQLVRVDGSVSMH